MNRGAHLQELLIALALSSVVYPSTPSAFSSSETISGCAYTTTDYAAPENARYEMLKSPGGGFYYNYSSRKTDQSPRNTGLLVVLVAGVPEPHYFDALRALLLEANYRVLVLDLPGKQHTRLSSRPTAEFVFEQFQEIWTLPGLYPPTGFLIVGTSISGPVAALMAARWAGRSPKLALLSAVGMPREWPLVIRIGRIPLLSDLLAPFMLPRQVEDRWKNGELLCPQNFPELFKRQEMEFRGAFARINHLELGKALALSDQTSVYQQLANTSLPVMLAYGDHDPFRDQISKIRDVVPRAQVITIRDSAHIAFIEQPAATFEILHDFAQGRLPGSSGSR
jgi:pimeloyl-ACP methyl ester carboxylesterase